MIPCHELLRVATGSVVLAIAAMAGGATPVLTPLGAVEVDGVLTAFTSPMGVTNSGVVVGTSSMPGQPRVGMRWSSATGIDNLGSATMVRCSADARSIALSGMNASQTASYGLWRSHTGPVALGTSNFSVADITLDGSMILRSDGVLWSQGAGEQQVPRPVGTLAFYADGMAGDASCFIGSLSSGSAPAISVLMQDGAIVVNFSALLGGNVQTRFLSDDGSTVLGSRQASSGAQALGFRFNRTSGLQYIPLPAGASADANMFLNSSTSDGSVVLGIIQESTGFSSVIWDSVNGTRRLRSVLESQGMDLSEWSSFFLGAYMSGNGRYVIGYGDRILPMGTTEFQSWVIDLHPPEAAACPGDADGSGQVNFTDITSVLGNFGSSCP